MWTTFLGVSGPHSVQRYRLETTLAVPVENTKLSFANAHSTCQHCLKDRFKFAWRAADHAEHFGCCYSAFAPARAGIAIVTFFQITGGFVQDLDEAVQKLYP